MAYGLSSPEPPIYVCQTRVPEPPIVAGSKYFPTTKSIPPLAELSNPPTEISFVIPSTRATT